MKKTPLFILTILSASLFFGCGSSNKDSVEQANDSNENKETTGSVIAVSEDEAQYLVESYDIGLAEVDMGNAAAKSSNKSIADFGSMMVTDHTSANSAIESLASKKSVTLPSTMSETHMKHVNDLKMKTGSDFDKDYINMMIDGHKDAISKSEKISTDAKDDDIRALAAQMLPTLRVHLEKANAIKESMK